MLKYIYTKVSQKKKIIYSILQNLLNYLKISQVQKTNNVNISIKNFEQQSAKNKISKRKQ